MKIRLILVLLVATLLLASCNGGVEPKNNSTEKETTTEEITMQPIIILKPDNLVLSNTLYHLLDGEITIGYFGGSVTLGTGATNKETMSWRARTTAWIKSNFSKVKVTERNAAIGNTGSVFGVFRADSQYIGEKAPDLNFIEMAINDSIDIVNGTRVLDSNDNYVYIESIIQKIYASNPQADIVFVLTGNYERLKDEWNGGAQFGTPYIEIGEYYQIPVIYAGKEMAAQIVKENGGTFPEKSGSEYPDLWKKYYKDNVHPLDDGYLWYTQAVVSFLKTQLMTDYCPKEIETKQLPEKYYCDVNHKGSLLLDAALITSKSFEGNANLGNVTVTSTGNTNSPNALTFSNSGDTLKLQFTGDSLGFWAVAPKTAEKATISYSIDGNPEQQMEVYYNSSSANNKAFYFCKGIEKGTHTIQITNKSSQKFEIRYFFISGCDHNAAPICLLPQ